MSPNQVEYRGVMLYRVVSLEPVGEHWDADYPGFGKITNKTLEGLKSTVDTLKTGYRPGGV